MLKKWVCVILIQASFVSQVQALEIYLNNPPTDYSVYEWSARRKSIIRSGRIGGIDGFTFSVPDQYIVRRKGKVNISATLRNWRRHTAVQDGNPRTRGGIGYYPFKDVKGNQHYVALEYLNDRIKKYSGVMITTNASTSESDQEESQQPSGSDKPKTNTQQSHRPSMPMATSPLQAPDDGSSSEIVGGGNSTEHQNVAEEDPVSNATFDLNGCRYEKVCWSDKSIKEKIKKIVANVDSVNKMHGSQVNPRYFLCTGWKESRFNPGAVGSNGDKGMFQVMPATGKAALRYKSLIPGFQNMSGQQFMSKMVNSTLAQTELSYLTLKMKVAEGVSKRVLDGTGSVNDYQTLAYRYNGQGPRARRYSRHISMCYSCLLHAMPNTSEFNSNSVENCLGKADY